MQTLPIDPGLLDIIRTPLWKDLVITENGISWRGPDHTLADVKETIYRTKNPAALLKSLIDKGLKIVDGNLTVGDQIISVEGDRAESICYLVGGNSGNRFRKAVFRTDEDTTSCDLEDLLSIVMDLFFSADPDFSKIKYQTKVSSKYHALISLLNMIAQGELTLNENFNLNETSLRDLCALYGQALLSLEKDSNPSSVDKIIASLRSATQAKLAQNGK